MYVWKTIFLIKSSLLRTINTIKKMLGYFIEGEEAKTHSVIIVVFRIIAGPHRVGAQIHQQEAPHCPQKNWSLLSSAIFTLSSVSQTQRELDLSSTSPTPTHTLIDRLERVNTCQDSLPDLNRHRTRSVQISERTKGQCGCRVYTLVRV